MLYKIIFMERYLQLILFLDIILSSWKKKYIKYLIIKKKSWHILYHISMYAKLFCDLDRFFSFCTVEYLNQVNNQV